jgi:type IV pilus modification protein PilV
MRRRPIERRGEAGFTLVEVLVSLIILTIGLAGILGLALSGSNAAGYARHATEASVVAQDKLESLRVQPAATLTSGADIVDGKAFVNVNGLYTRTWTVSWNGTLANLVVATTWKDGGSDHTITYRTMRGQ